MASESSPKPGKVRTWWHPMLATLLRWQLEATYEVQEEVNVGVKPLQIDIVLILRGLGALSDEVRRILAGLADLLNDYTLVELKGPTDDLRAGDFSTLVGYANLYCAQNAPLLDRSRLSLVVLAPQLTQGYRDELKVCQVTARQVVPGIWRLEGTLLFPTWLLETNRLAAAEFPLLTLFSPAMLKEPFRWAQDLRARGLETLLVYVTQQVRQFQTRGERFAMTHWGAEEMQRVKRELIQEECKTMSPEELRVFLGLDDWLKNMPAEERLKGLSPEERLQGLSDEERERLRALLQQAPKN